MQNHSFISTLGFGWLAAACVQQQRIWLVWVKTECFGLLRKGPGSVLLHHPVYYMVISFSRVCMVFSGVVSVSHGLLTCLVNMVFEFGVLVSISVCMLARGIMVQLLSRSGTKMKILKLTENSNLTSDSGFPSLITYILTIHLSKSDQE